MTIRASCEICNRIIDVSDTYDAWKRPAICRPTADRHCVLILSLFNQLWSDKAIYEREFFELQRKLPPP